MSERSVWKRFWSPRGWILQFVAEIESVLTNFNIFYTLVHILYQIFPLNSHIRLVRRTWRWLRNLSQNSSSQIDNTFDLGAILPCNWHFLAQCYNICLDSTWQVIILHRWLMNISELKSFNQEFFQILHHKYKVCWIVLVVGVIQNFLSYKPDKSAWYYLL